MESYKFTPEYCKTHKVAIYVDTSEEVKLCDELLENSNAHYYLHTSLSYKGNQAIDCQNSSHCSVEWFESHSYEVIKAKDFINSNTKNMEKKLIGYKLIKPEMLQAASIIIYGNPAGSTQLRTILTQEDYIAKLRKAGVLDLWFEPVYEEEVKFKVGDWVLLGGNANGWGSSPHSVNNKILQITKIDLEDQFNVGGIYYFGKEMTVGKEIIRKATPAEVLDFKVKEFTEKTGIEVGSTIVAPNLIVDKCCWENGEGWRTSVAHNNREVLRFSIHSDGKTLLIGVNNTHSDIWFDAYKMRLANSFPNIEINGYKAEETLTGVKFGCQSYTKEFVITLADCLVTNGFNMDFEEEVIELSNYFQTK